MDDFGRLSSPPNGVSSSQPDRFSSGDNSLSPVSEVLHPFSFSQPVQPDDLLLNSQIQCTPGTTQTPFQKFVKRMTRFFVHTSRQEAVKEMEKFLRHQGYGVKKNSNFELTISTVDKSKSRLIFKVYFIEMAGNVLVEFRMSKGDGLEFKRHFVRIKKKLQHMIRKTPPTWPTDDAGDDAKAKTDACEPTEAESNNPDPLATSTPCSSASTSAVSHKDSGAHSCSSSSKDNPQKDESTDPSLSSSKGAQKAVSSKRTLEESAGTESNAQKKMKRKETDRPSLDAKKAKEKNVDAAERLRKEGKDKNCASSVQRKADDSLANVNGERQKLQQYMKTAKESYYGLHRSTTM
ncbi:hypothetical protein EGW08_022445 [Elysia chlorotica]|uniref:Non-specific serine/threonine protein kinase n=1 Tax=Elysia chlorotica TaxID=188477 RepID=A0A3S1AR66_ELYCH|nr:hypothetical protein EGW08_022445 [Elysia chlorotica]